MNWPQTTILLKLKLQTTKNYSDFPNGNLFINKNPKLSEFNLQYLHYH